MTETLMTVNPLLLTSSICVCTKHLVYDPTIFFWFSSVSQNCFFGTSCQGGKLSCLGYSEKNAVVKCRGTVQD